MTFTNQTSAKDLFAKYKSWLLAVKNTLTLSLVTVISIFSLYLSLNLENTYQTLLPHDHTVYILYANPHNHHLSIFTSESSLIVTTPNTTIYPVASRTFALAAPASTSARVAVASNTSITLTTIDTAKPQTIRFDYDTRVVAIAVWKHLMCAASGTHVVVWDYIEANMKTELKLRSVPLALQVYENNELWSMHLDAVRRWDLDKGELLGEFGVTHMISSKLADNTGWRVGNWLRKQTEFVSAFVVSGVWVFVAESNGLVSQIEYGSGRVVRRWRVSVVHFGSGSRVWEIRVIRRRGQLLVVTVGKLVELWDVSGEPDADEIVNAQQKGTFLTRLKKPYKIFEDVPPLRAGRGGIGISISDDGETIYLLARDKHSKGSIVIKQLQTI
ncbi:hypothetical protein HK096_004107 [Nowakowskiella sp. JEL0078]|nr:hypothetical protein HK096_004107 [Nowakowskiella sp. JEL0078]